MLPTDKTGSGRSRDTSASAISDPPAHWIPAKNGDADPAALAVAGSVRITVLTSRLLRLEWDPAQRFEDRPSQAFWHRRQEVPEFRFGMEQGALVVETEHLRLHYTPRPGGFTAENLVVLLKASGTSWNPGLVDPANLGGTVPTLDNIDGPLPLPPGLVSRSGWSLVDDSAGLVFGADGWLTPRHADPVGVARTQDWYFFGHGSDYRACLRDFCRVSGQTPLIPRWVLGNWWSRYWPYTQDQLQALMEEFRSRGIPFAVCVLDMDWHVLKNPHHRGWTGYTWNRELIPDPDGLLNWLHSQGLRSCLNLHPHDGIHPHEDCYGDMARALGLDPATKQAIPFRLSDPHFAKAYFECAHHSLERQGVDFWWMDWQQGSSCEMPGLDPLFWLNHLHFLDLGRDPARRPLAFSRWHGLGGQRYPIMFSGDTVATWRSLAFQPFFTSTAANAGCWWWSHDIGGHLSGLEDAELYVRWVQFGVFSPILRLHSGRDALMDRRPWGHGQEALRIARHYLRLRHRLIPYLYTLAWEAAEKSAAPVEPMYYGDPDCDQAYACPQQYRFGPHLVVAPFTRPAEADLGGLARQVVWLPAGVWYDFFTGRRFEGDAWHAVYGDLEMTPVFAAAGAIVPLAPEVDWDAAALPDALEIRVFAGASDTFRLREDDGAGQGYRLGEWSEIEIVQRFEDDLFRVEVSAASGHRAHLPERRSWSFRIFGLGQPDAVVVWVGADDGTWRRIEALPAWTHDAESEILILDPITITPGQGIRIEIQSAVAGPGQGAPEEGEATTAPVAGDSQKSGGSAHVPMARYIRDSLRVSRALVERFHLHTRRKHHALKLLGEWEQNPAAIVHLAGLLSPSQFRAIAETMLGAGWERSDCSGSDFLVVWNNHERPDVRYTLDAGRKGTGLRAGSVPRFLRLALDAPANTRDPLVVRTLDPWSFALHYAGAATQVLDNAPRAAQGR